MIQQISDMLTALQHPVFAQRLVELVEPILNALTHRGDINGGQELDFVHQGRNQQVEQQSDAGDDEHQRDGCRQGAWELPFADMDFGQKFHQRGAQQREHKSDKDIDHYIGEKPAKEDDDP